MQTAPPSCNPHCTRYQKGQDPVHSRLNLWPLSNPSVLPQCPAYADHHHYLQTWEQYPLGALTDDGNPLHTSFLAPSLAICLEAKLEEVPSWTFSLGGWDKSLLKGSQLGI